MRPSIDTELTRRLVDAQFPQWAGLPLERVEPGGSDHVIHRLGGELAVRMPRHPGPLGALGKEFAWLPRLAPRLPLAVPVPVAQGRPGFGYPWPWSVSRWLDGETATTEKLGDDTAAAGELAGFLLALWDFGRVHRPAPGTAAVPPPQPLADRDRATRAAIARAADTFDAEAMTAVWDAALAAEPWNRPPVWVHGDFHTGNLLTVGGRLSAVIDFSGLAFGDPATDLMMAYSLMAPPGRALFRTALAPDADTWARGRGWGLTGALLAYTAYAHESPGIAAATTRQIHAVLEDRAEDY
ncbi:aminoglycoside phosphotransferase family protein [Streptomyces endophyticus]|uniref:Aminoglycoside phosphotransferase family protein n=1 Tax=Streptomyces endophyticus TaxID=714166 RepID=A0ABU6FFH6_9ACTN|nr:aminoglycoside phosphotransferase family protein [Streptomyces endophyticus]MEB8342392.1 aminoglycoside phosphotransferase family protein [Streptomyces endophyticus]